jgi:hypothetical protein
MRTSYRMYLKENPLGITIYADSFYVSDDGMVFFSVNDVTVCVIPTDRLDCVRCDDKDIWTSSVTEVL